VTIFIEILEENTRQNHGFPLLDKGE